MAATILIVDDEPLTQKLFTQYFREQIATKAYELLFASNVIQALCLIKSNPSIDLILLDLKMPGADSFTLLNQLNGTDINYTIVIVSGFGHEKNVRKTMNQKAYDFVKKPIDLKDLRETVQKALKETEKRNSKIVKAEESALEIKGKKPHTNRLLKWISEAPAPQRVKTAIHLIKTIDDREQIDEIGCELENQTTIARINQSEKEQLLIENERRITNGEPPLNIEEFGWIEMRYVYTKLVNGEKNKNGPYFYLRWREEEEREKPKQQHIYYGKEDPRPHFNSDIKVYEVEIGKENNNLTEETPPEDQRQPKTFRLTLKRP